MEINMNHLNPQTKKARDLKTIALATFLLLALGTVLLLAWHYGAPIFTGMKMAGGSKSGEPEILFYRNPMDPAITSPVPAKDWMGMDYIPVYAEGTAPKTQTPEAEAEAFFAEETGSLPKTVKGLAPITLSEQAIRVAGVITSPAIRERFHSTIRTVGRVIPDETRVRSVQTKIEGWVDKLFVNFTGQPVKAGDPVLALYSPMLVSSQEEFLQAKQTAAELVTSKDPEIKKSGELLLKAARRRLEYFDVPETFIDSLLTSKKAQRTVPIFAPVSGLVTVKDVLEGQKVAPGMALFTVADLSTIWVEAEFYEYEAGSLKIGQEAILSAPFDSVLSRKGRISFIYPFLNAESRTLKARLEFENDSLVLKPGMFVDVDLLLDLGESVVIPDSAVMDSGTRKVVFVQTASGGFSPREIRTGTISRGKAQVLSGIEAGENVVTRANFLLDSESRLQAIVEEAMQAKAPSNGGGKP
jgi:membrane fusion protein, copper/silver efflux system